MSSHQPTTPPQAPRASKPLTSVEEIEEVTSEVGLAAGVTLRAVDVAVVALVALLVCPPLMILVVVVVVPLIALAALVSLIAAVLALPYLLVRHRRGHRDGHAELLLHRLRHAGGAVLACLPHRVVADARKLRRSARA